MLREMAQMQGVLWFLDLTGTCRPGYAFPLTSIPTARGSMMLSYRLAWLSSACDVARPPFVNQSDMMSTRVWRCSFVIKQLFLFLL